MEQLAGEKSLSTEVYDYIFSNTYCNVMLYVGPDSPLHYTSFMLIQLHWMLKQSYMGIKTI